MSRNAITSLNTSHDHAIFAFDKTAALLRSIRSGSIARDLALAQDDILKLNRSSEGRSEFRVQFNQSKFPQSEADATASSLPTITIGDHPENSQPGLATPANDRGRGLWFHIPWKENPCILGHFGYKRINQRPPGWLGIDGGKMRLWH